QRPNRLVARHRQRYRHPSTLAERIPQPQNRMDRRKPRLSPQKPVRQRPRKPAILTAMLTCPETQLNWPENQRSNGRKPLDKTHPKPGISADQATRTDIRYVPGTRNGSTTSTNGVASRATSRTRRARGSNSSPEL